MPAFCPCPKFLSDNFAIFKLLSQPQDEIMIQPNYYLSASNEVFGITLLTTWVLTLLFYPHQIHEHPARPIIGSYNPCFGWDYAPASYIALTGCSTNVYLTWRYSFLEMTRTNLIAAGRSLTCIERFATFTSSCLALASNFWLLLWLIGPNDDDPYDEDGPNMKNWFLHTGIFVSYGSAAYLAALGNYLEVKFGKTVDTVKWQSTAYIIVYGVCLGYLVLVYFYDLIMFENGRPPALDPFFTQLADILWMLTFSNINRYLPLEPPLKITHELGTMKDVEDPLE